MGTGKSDLPGSDTSVTIRDAEPDDFVALQEIFRRSSLSNERDRPALRQNPDALELPNRPVGDRMRIAAVAGETTGLATTHDAGGALELVDLFVDPSWMRRGIGHALVEDAAAYALAGGCGRLEVTANPHALAFYERERFVVDHEVDTRFGSAPRMHLTVTR